VRYRLEGACDLVVVHGRHAPQSCRGPTRLSRTVEPIETQSSAEPVVMATT
jgi:tRNA-dihydrouridine synthase